MMARAVFEIARDFQDKIFGDLKQAQSFKDMAQESVLSDFQIPEKLSATRLGNLNNQFAIQDRANTFATDLAANQTKSQTGVVTAGTALLQAQEDAANFQDNATLERLKKENELAKEKEARRKYVFLADNAQKQEELLKLEVEGEIAAQRANIEENMNTFEKYQANREFDGIMAEIPDWESLPQGQRVMLVWDKAKGKNISKPAMELVKLRLREEMSDDVAALKYLDEILFEKNSATTVADAAKVNAMVKKFAMSMRNVDRQTLTFAISKGILSAADFNPLIFDALSAGTDPSLLVEQTTPDGAPVENILDDPTDTSLEGTTTPAPLSPELAPTEPTGATPVDAATQPPVLEPDLPEPQLSAEDLALNSNMTLKQVEETLKTMTGEAVQVVLTIPKSPVEATELIANLESIGAMLDKTTEGDQKEAALNIIVERIIDITEQFAGTGE
jgi:hypothetical protein